MQAWRVTRWLTGRTATGARWRRFSTRASFRRIVGLDPWQSEAIWQKLWARQRHLYNQSDSLVGVIDVAVWDLRGKMASSQLRHCSGSSPTSSRAYMTARSEASTAEEVAAEATAAKAAGYHGYKLQLRDGPAKDIPRLRAAREAVGAGFRLMQDPNSSYRLG